MAHRLRAGQADQDQFRGAPRRLLDHLVAHVARIARGVRREAAGLAIDFVRQPLMMDARRTDRILRRRTLHGAARFADFVHPRLCATACSVCRTECQSGVGRTHGHGARRRARHFRFPPLPARQHPGRARRAQARHACAAGHRRIAFADRRVCRNRAANSGAAVRDAADQCACACRGTRVRCDESAAGIGTAADGDDRVFQFRGIEPDISQRDLSE